MEAPAETVSGRIADQVSAGQSLTYTLHVTNTGPAGAPAVVVTDTLPAGVSYV